jgi:hypothetical protein
MKNLEFEESIKEFLQIGRQLHAERRLTADHALSVLTEWYRGTRVAGATLDQNEDMLLLQWGAMRPLRINQPSDLRGLTDADISFSDDNRQYLALARQLSPTQGDDDEDFDNAAVQLSITLTYVVADGDEPSSNLWIRAPSDLENGIRDFRADPFVASLLFKDARAIITVEHCG